MSASEKSVREWRWEGGRESGISTEELEVGPRSAQRHARRDDQREREGPCCSAMKAQFDDPLSRATLTQLSSMWTFQHLKQYVKIKCFHWDLNPKSSYVLLM